MGKLISYIRGFASKVEADKIRERTMRGKTARLKEGKMPHGTGIGIYGYDWYKETGHRTINELESKVVQRIFSMVLQGISFYKIAVELNKAGIMSKSGSMWHPLTIRRIVTNETYTGKTYSGKTQRIARTKVTTRPKEEWFLLPDVTPQIITEEMFNHVQEVILQAKQARPIKKNVAYLLTGFIKCPKCGSPIGGTMMGGKYRYYKCRGAVPTTLRGKICDAGYIKADQLESDVWNRVIKMASNPVSLIVLIMDSNRIPQDNDVKPMLDKQIAKLRKKLKTYKTKEQNLINLLSHDIVTSEYVLESISKLKQECKSDERQLEDLLVSRKQASENEPITLKLSEVSEQMRSDAAEAANSNDLELKRNILERLQLQVTADPKTHQFSFRFYGLLVSSSQAETQDFINEKYYEFEKQHPEYSIDDIVNPDIMLPDDSKFAQILNPVKKKLQVERDLVTTARTSA